MSESERDDLICTVATARSRICDVISNIDDNDFYDTDDNRIIELINELLGRLASSKICCDKLLLELIHADSPKK